MRRVLLLWGAFLAVHLWLIVLNLAGPGQPLGDVEWVYPFWITQGLAGHWVGIDLPFVYPIGALLPIVLPHLVVPEAYPAGWLVMVSLLDAVALRVLLGRGGTDGRRFLVAAGWVGYLLALGPIALGRIDSVTVPLGIAAVSVLARHPRVAAGLLTAGAWIKVWPAALVAALVVADPRRRRIAITAAGTTLVIVAVAEIIGSGGNVLSFVTQQTGRGLQIEAPAATPFVVAAAVGGPWSLYYDTTILTYQLRGDGVAEVAALLTPLLVLIVLALLVVAVLGLRRGADPATLLPWLGFAAVLALLVANKVGSPQFVSWLAVPVALGLLQRGFRVRGGFGLPAIGVLLVALLTQGVYPTFYDQVVGLRPGGVTLLLLRNLLEAVLFVVAVTRLVRAAYRPDLLRDRSTTTLSEGAIP